MRPCHLVKNVVIPALVAAHCSTPLFAQKTHSKKKAKKSHVAAHTRAANTPFNVEAESFADLQVLRYQVPGFNELSLQQKKLAYYLAEAALCGRDIIYDQKSKYGLMLRKTMEAAYTT